ncbi:MAG: hypothetical protein IJ570_07225 [Prevotella sp.]|nr:hypothetical protein [Prevotella sp.]
MRIKKYWMMLAITLVSLCTISCGEDDDDDANGSETTITANDPEGTVVVNLANDNKKIHIPDTPLRMTAANNIELMEGRGIISVGKVKNLAAVTAERAKCYDQSSWGQYTVAALPGYGYIAVGFYRLTRFYVVDYIVDTSGGIMGVTIKYQTDWSPYDK